MFGHGGIKESAHFHEKLEIFYKMNEVVENRWSVPIRMKAKELEKSLLKYEWNILAKATAFFSIKEKRKQDETDFG